MVDVQTVKRSFQWGLVVIADRDNTESFPVTGIGESGVQCSGAGVAVRVRHREDQELGCGEYAEVTLNLFVDKSPSSQAGQGHELAVPSGVLVIGDADAMWEVGITPGRWSVHVALDDARGAEVVDIWLTPGAGA